MTPFRFTPFLKSVIWGGKKIATLKHIKTDRTDIGESWEISGVPNCETRVADGPDKGLPLSALIEKYRQRLIGLHVWNKFGTTFPLLVKIIDANSDLSVQVHPDDELSAKRHNSAGKTEMWYILSAEPEAKIYAGLSRQLDPTTYKEAVASNSIMEFVEAHESHPGDVFFLPAGRVHAIGAGNLLLEIQQTSDITYRIYDYDRRDAAGNPRELHTELAADAIDYTIYPAYKSQPSALAQGIDSLAQCQYFDVRKHDIKGCSMVDYADGTFVIVSCVEGIFNVTTDDETEKCQLTTGQTILVPAKRNFLKFEGAGTAVTAFVPYPKKHYG